MASTKTASIKIDGVEYQAEAGANLLETCLNLGLDLPYFCWHPAMGSIGACRQCALVQYLREEDSHGRIVMGCMTPVTDGAIFSLCGDQAATFRTDIVESLMLNHPHDCPVCAEGGECHLQDMTVMVGHRDRHYRGRKNTHRNQYLGPLIHHEMNRCITCYRCTRYYQDYAGGTDLAAMAAGDHIYFGRHEEGLLQNEFAGNLVEVCPTGVFTDKSLVKEYTRKWDLQSAPSVCVGCAVGCNTLPGERYGKLKRIHNRYNKAVNGYFLCDRGRFGGGFVNSEKRLNYAAQRADDGSFKAVDTTAALAAITTQLQKGKLAGIGSPRASIESNQLLRELVGADNYQCGMADEEARRGQRILAQLSSTPAHNPSLSDIESADAILILGEDVTHIAPRTALALRQSVRNLAYSMAAELQLQPWQDAAIRNLAQDQRSPLHIVAAFETGLADVAASNACLQPAQQVELTQQIAQVLRGERSEGEIIDNSTAEIANNLLSAQRPLVICGTTGSAALIDGAASIAESLCQQGKPAMLSYCLPECNSLGVSLLASGSECSLEQLTARATAGEINTLLIMENDLFRRAAAEQVEQLMAAVECCIGLDCLEQATLERCQWVLPAAAFTEAEGTLVSSEGRAQRFFPVHVASAQRRASWQWLTDLADRDLSFDEVSQACAQAIPSLQGIIECAPDHEFRNRGLKIPRQTHRYSGRTAMHADVSVHEPKQAEDTESALAFTMEGRTGEQPGALLPYVWSPGWNSNQSIHKFQSEVGGTLRGGTCGVRLLDSSPSDSGANAPVTSTDLPTSGIAGSWIMLPRHQAFGSDELSMYTPPIAEVAGSALIYLSEKDASKLDVTEGDGVQAGERSLEVRIDTSMAEGCAAYSVGHPQTAGLLPDQHTQLARDDSWVRRQPSMIASDSGGGHV